jgi:hypothetical protein
MTVTPNLPTIAGAPPPDPSVRVSDHADACQPGMVMAGLLETVTMRDPCGAASGRGLETVPVGRVAARRHADNVANKLIRRHVNPAC